MSDNSVDPAKLGKAEAAAEKAKAKALRPWYKKKRFIVPIALVVLAGLSQAMNGDGGSVSTGDTSGTAANSTEENSTGDSANNASEERPGFGTPVVDGAFSFTVLGMECGIAQVGSDTFGEEAQGQFCLVDLKIENVGDEPQTMFADNQKIFDSQGREFSPDTSAMIYMEDGADAWLSEINPGNTLEGKLLFDVPVDAELDYIELHDSVFSGGVEVSLK